MTQDGMINLKAGTRQNLAPMTCPLVRDEVRRRSGQRGLPVGVTPLYSVIDGCKDNRRCARPQRLCLKVSTGS